MQLHHKAFGALTLATSLLCSMPFMAAAESLTNNDVVHSSSGQVVRSIKFGTCVRTKWEHGSDECAPPVEVAEKQEPRKQYRTTLEEQERSVYFEFNKSTLTPEAMRKLDSLSEKLRNAKDISSTEIVGFADRIGSVSYNQTLSMQRAQAVKDYLAARGYLKTRLAGVHGVGETEPTTHCASDMARKNAITCLHDDRRVEINVNYTQSRPMTRN